MILTTAVPLIVYGSLIGAMRVAPAPLSGPRKKADKIHPGQHAVTAAIDDGTKRSRSVSRFHASAKTG